MPDVKHCGDPGATAHRPALPSRPTQVAPHNPSGPVALAATAHAVLGLSFAILEHAFGEAEAGEGLVDPPEASWTATTAPGGPGLGLRLNPAGIPCRGAGAPQQT